MYSGASTLVSSKKVVRYLLLELRFKGIKMRSIFIITLCICLYGCEYFFDVENEISEKFVGETYCAANTLFVWGFKDESADFSYQKYSLMQPIEDENTLSEHKLLISNKYIGLPVKDVFLVREGTKVRVLEVRYMLRLPDGSRYFIIVEVDGLGIVSNNVDAISMFEPRTLNRGDEMEAKINRDYLGSCDAYGDSE